MRTMTAVLATAMLAGAAQAAPITSDPVSEAAFLAGNAHAPRVVALPGVQYQVLSSGAATGAHPTRAEHFLQLEMIEDAPHPHRQPAVRTVPQRERLFIGHVDQRAAGRAFLDRGLRSVGHGEMRRLAAARRAGKGRRFVLTNSRPTGSCCHSLPALRC